MSLHPSRSPAHPRRAASTDAWDRVQAVATEVGTAAAARFVGILVVVALGLGGAWYGLCHAQAALFRGNPKFTLRKLEITTGNTVSPEAIRQVTGIREGNNVFAFDLPRIRRDFLRNLPNVREIRIERRLPDHIRISVFERIPLARLSRNGRVVVDFDGYIFVVQPAQEAMADALPVVASEEWANMVPGQRVGERTRSALNVVDAADSLRLGFRIVGLDTTGPHYLLLQTMERQEIGLPWKAVAKRETVTEMLSNVNAVIASPRATNCNRFDVSPEDGKVFARFE